MVSAATPNTTTETEDVLNNTADLFDAADSISPSLLTQIKSQDSSRFSLVPIVAQYYFFLNATIKGRQTGVALHSASSHVAELGSRASGGCVRLPPEKAAELFERFRASEQGMVPVFAYDAAHRRTSGDGVILHDTSGRPVLTPGYRVLLFIEDYPGGPALVAVVA